MLLIWDFQAVSTLLTGLGVHPPGLTLLAPHLPRNPCSSDKLALSDNISHTSLLRSLFNLFGRLLLLMRVLAAPPAQNAAKVLPAHQPCPAQCWPPHCLAFCSTQSSYPHLKHFLPFPLVIQPAFKTRNYEA